MSIESFAHPELITMGRGWTMLNDLNQSGPTFGVESSVITLHSEKRMQHSVEFWEHLAQKGGNNLGGKQHIYHRRHDCL